MPYIQNVEFQNETGQTLAGRLHLPLSPFRGAALFAHCFTCSKDITAAKRIAESLSLSGLAVLRFDFTGLAQSQGDFATTSFHTNLAGLGACTAMTVKMYARRKGWLLDDVQIQLSHAKIHQQDLLASSRLDQMTRQIKQTGPLEDAQRDQLMQIADKCPVHKTLEAGVQIQTTQS